MRQIVIALTVLALAGCATKPVAPNLARDVPADRAITHQSPISGGGMITVVRDKGMTGSGCYAGVFVNGELAAKLGTAERVNIYLPVGRSILASHSVGAGLCGIELQKRGERATAVQITAGDSFTYRLALSSDGIVTLTPLN